MGLVEWSVVIYYFMAAVKLGGTTGNNPRPWDEGLFFCHRKGDTITSLTIVSPHIKRGT